MELIFANSEKRNKILKELKKQYPIGAKVELVSMKDSYVNLPNGLKGKVIGIDDAGTIHVQWENGSSLGVLYGIDKVKKIEK